MLVSIIAMVTLYGSCLISAFLFPEEYEIPPDTGAGAEFSLLAGHSAQDLIHNRHSVNIVE